MTLKDASFLALQVALIAACAVAWVFPQHGTFVLLNVVFYVSGFLLLRRAFKRGMHTQQPHMIAANIRAQGSVFTGPLEKVAITAGLVSVIALYLR